MKKLLKEKTALLLEMKLFRFAVTGGISTGIDFLLYMIISMRVHIVAAKIISMLCAGIYSFVFNKWWTFSDKKKVSAGQILKYILVQVINISVNTGTNTFFYSLTGLKIAAFIIATGVAMIVNYFLQKILVFKGEVS